MGAHAARFREGALGRAGGGGGGVDGGARGCETRGGAAGKRRWISDVFPGGGEEDGDRSKAPPVAYGASSSLCAWRTTRRSRSSKSTPRISASWVAHVERKVAPPGVRQRLENRLLALTRMTTSEKPGRSPVPRQLRRGPRAACLAETKHFERMYFQIPHVCAELGGSREKYRVMREDVIGLVTAYNDVMLRLDADERRLFRDLGALDKKIAPGLQKVNWTSSKTILEFYMTESLKQVGDVKAQVDAFKECMDVGAREVRGDERGVLGVAHQARPGGRVPAGAGDPYRRRLRRRSAICARRWRMC